MNVKLNQDDTNILQYLFIDPCDHLSVCEKRCYNNYLVSRVTILQRDERKVPKVTRKFMEIMFQTLDFNPVSGIHNLCKIDNPTLQITFILALFCLIRQCL